MSRLLMLNADARHIPLADESVNCVVTSPPYWGLRDYGTAKWEGGDAGCDHRANGERRQLPHGDGRVKDSYADERHHIAGVGAMFKERCGKCGAVRVDAQLGLEPTPEAYVETMVRVFREVRRVLRPDGVVFLNLGDSYFGDSPPRRSSSEAFSKTWDKSQTASRGGLRRSAARANGLKPKDLCMIPARVALALQADGWWLRSDIVWSKPNPMPESVTDRPTRSHEYLFLLAKSATYFYDAEAIKEPNASGPSDIRKMIEQKDRIDAKHFHDDPGPLAKANPMTNIGRKRGVGSPDGRNARSVWHIATSPYPGAHFATFPEKLVEPCVKAGTSAKGCCPKCGAGWERIVDRIGGPPPGDHRKRKDSVIGGKTAHETGTLAGSHLSNIYRKYGYVENKLLGWRPGCACPSHDPVPAVVLDPFAGSGTVGRVAVRLGRSAVLCDLSMAYLSEQATKRTSNVQIEAQL